MPFVPLLNRTAFTFYSGAMDVAGLVVCSRGRHFSAGADVGQLRGVAVPGDPDSARALREVPRAWAAFAGVALALSLGLCLLRVRPAAALFIRGSSTSASFWLTTSCPTSR